MKKVFFICMIIFNSQFFLQGVNASEEVFSDIYETGYWFSGESYSGDGSDLRETEVIRRELPQLLREYEIKVMIDAACGDLNWIKTIDLPIEKYIGVDIVEKLIKNNTVLYGNNNREFLRIDISQDILPYSDIILCRDCLTHYPLKKAKDIILRFKESGAKYLLVSTYPKTIKNNDLGVTGYHSRPLNMEREPFDFPVPLKLIDEHSKHKKYLGLWLLKDIEV